MHNSGLVLFDRFTLENANMVVFAKSGAGKSFAVKQRRANAVMKAQQKISAGLNKKMIGKTLKVLFDKKEGNYFIGRSEFDSPDVDNLILVKAHPSTPKGRERQDVYVRIGDFADVVITGAKEYDLIGELINKK